MNLLNDGEEKHWGYAIFIAAVNRLLKRENVPAIIPTISKEFFDKVDEIWHRSGLHIASFVASFSTDGDSLSQWRAYADDGRGFAIGFDIAELSRFPIQVLDVLYDKDQQMLEMMAALAAVHKRFEETGKTYDHPEFFKNCLLLLSTSVALKNPA
jgi:hypothetical protein